MLRQVHRRPPGSQLKRRPHAASLPPAEIRPLTRCAKFDRRTFTRTITHPLASRFEVDQMTAAMVCMLAALSAAPVAPKVRVTARTVSMPGGDLLWPQFRGPGGEGRATSKPDCRSLGAKRKTSFGKRRSPAPARRGTVIQGNLVWITTTVELPLPPEAAKPEPKPEDERKRRAPDAEKKPAPPAKKPPIELHRLSRSRAARFCTTS